MSFPALYLACQAVADLEPLDDPEFGLSWSDIGFAPEMDITWALYRSEGAGLVFGVKQVDQQSIDEFLAMAR